LVKKRAGGTKKTTWCPSVNSFLLRETEKAGEGGRGKANWGPVFEKRNPTRDRKGSPG